ncbi:MAG: hypothetical protein IT178_10870 [Acidobacteria bacterium]|nr:hypothetical protein [Acidobacteriota bacterium]
MGVERITVAKLCWFGGLTAVAAAATQFAADPAILAALPLLGGAGAYANSVAQNLAADLAIDAAHSSADTGRARGLLNRDLHRLIGQAIARVLERDSAVRPDGQYLAHAARAFRGAAWMEVTLTGTETELAERKASRWFAGSPERIKNSPVLTVDAWIDLVSKVAGPPALDERHSLRHAALHLKAGFAAELWEAAKGAQQKNDLAWPALVLRLLSETLGHSKAAAIKQRGATRQLMEATTAIGVLAERVRQWSDTRGAVVELSADDRQRLEAIHEYHHQVTARLDVLLSMQTQLLQRQARLETKVDAQTRLIGHQGREQRFAELYRCRQVLRQRLDRQLGRGDAAAAVAGVRYDAALFQSRIMEFDGERAVDCARVFDAFLRRGSSPSSQRQNCFVITGRTGHGKTTLLCHLAESVSRRTDAVVVLMRGHDLEKRSAGPRSRYDLAARFLDTLGGQADPALTRRGILEALRVRLLDMAGTMTDEPSTVVCFIDAINEVPHTTVEDLAELSSEIRDVLDLASNDTVLAERVRFCITCREEYWPRFTAGRAGQPSDIWLEHIWRPQRELDPTVRLSVFDGDELQRAKVVYFRRYRIAMEVEGAEALDRILCEPVLLRYFCEAYGASSSDETPPVIEAPARLTRLAIFEQMATRHRAALAPGMRDRDLSGDEIYRRSTDLLLAIAFHMYERRQVSFTAEEAYEIARRLEHPDIADADGLSLQEFTLDPRSTFARMVTERLVLERHAGAGVYSFVFDSYYEFTLGRFFALKRWRPVLARGGTAAYPEIVENLRALLGRNAAADAAAAGRSHAANVEAFNALAYAVLLVERDPEFKDHPSLFWHLVGVLLTHEQGSLAWQLGFAVIRDSQFALPSTWRIADTDNLVLRLRAVVDWTRHVMQSADHTSSPDAEETLRVLAATSREARRVILDGVAGWVRQTATPSPGRDDVGTRLERMSSTRILSLLRHGATDPLFDQHFLELCRLPNLIRDFWSARSLVESARQAAGPAASNDARTAQARYFEQVLEIARSSRSTPGTSAERFGDADAIRGVCMRTALAFAEYDHSFVPELERYLAEEPHPWVWWAVLHALADGAERLPLDFLQRVVSACAAMDSPHVRAGLFRLHDKLPAACATIFDGLRLVPHPATLWTTEPDPNRRTGTGASGVGIVYHPVMLESEHQNHPECRERLASILFAVDDLDGIAWFEPRRATAREVERAHNGRTDAHYNGAAWPDYVSRIRSTSSSQEAQRTRLHEGAMEMRPGMYDEGLVSAGAVLTAVGTLFPFQGLRAVFAINRPPGHLANNTICVFNNVAIAALSAVYAGMAERVLIVDIDAHHGRHTGRVFVTRRDVAYVSIHLADALSLESGKAENAGSGEGTGFTFNLAYPPASPIDDAAFVRLAADFVAPALRQFRPQLVLLSTGFDGLASDPLTPNGGRLSPSGYAAFGRVMRAAIDALRLEGVDTRVAGCLEGGYSLDHLGRAFVGLIQEFGAASATPILIEPGSPACAAAIDGVIEERLGILTAHEQPGYPFSRSGFAQYQLRPSDMGIQLIAPTDAVVSPPPA